MKQIYFILLLLISINLSNQVRTVPEKYMLKFKCVFCNKNFNSGLKPYLRYMYLKERICIKNAIINNNLNYAYVIFNLY